MNSLFCSDIRKKVITAYAQKRLKPAIYARIRPFLKGLKYILHNPSSLISLHCPEYVTPNKDELDTVKRIFTSFRKMKEDQMRALAIYSPSSLWQAQLNNAYSYLTSGAEKNDINKFHFFLANFGAWKEYTGVEESTLIQKYMKFIVTRRYLQNEIFGNLLSLWKYYDSNKSIEDLRRPNYGNFSGAYINGVLVTVDSFFGEIHGALLSDIVSASEHPVIGELGGGCARLAYYITRNINSFTYINFDLPETLCIAAYYLMMVYPEKKVLLYGEEKYSPDIHRKYDLIFMPSYEICKIGSFTFDIFINECSLGEMTRRAAENYIKYITKATRYFFSINHDKYPNVYDHNESSLLGHEYPISRDEFTLLFRYPEIKHMLFYGGKIDYNSDSFIYLYERKN